MIVISVKESFLIPIFKILPVNTRDSLFQSFQRLHVPWSLGSEHFFPNEGIPARTAIRTIDTIGLFLPAGGFCAGQFWRYPSFADLSCVTRKQSARKKWQRELQGFRSTRKEGLKSRIPLCSPFESRIPNPNPMKTRNPAPARNFYSRFSLQFWAQIPNITAKKCWIPHPAKLIGKPLIGKLRLALPSRFSCRDNVRTNFKSRQLDAVFPAKANLLALTIFKQRLPISWRAVL